MLEKQVKEEPLTKAELEHIKNLGPLTDYQKAAVEYTKMAKIFQDRADQANEDSTNEDRTIGAIKLELLKSSPMVEAKQQAEEIMKQVDNEIQKAIVEELKKKISDNLDIDPSDQILLDPKSLIQKKKVAEEDLKGLSVDETV